MDAVTPPGCHDRPQTPDSLKAIDELVADYRVEEQALEHAVAVAASQRTAFVEAATSALRHVVKPLFDTVASRLANDGGDGRVDVSDSEGRHGLRITLWMSLDGPIVGTPRQDLNPYVQLDLDAERRQVRVWEGDMWRGLGTSRPGSPLTEHDLTEEVVLARTMEVLRRAAEHTRRMIGVFDDEAR
jgi:hypothetical protein